MNILNAITTNAWGGLSNSFNLLWSKISPILLPLIFILAFLAVGLWIAGFISEKIGIIVKKGKIDTVLDRIAAPAAKLAGTKISSYSIVTGSVKWFLIALVLIAALDIADLNEVIDFFNQALGYLPNIFIAALILIVGSMLGNLAATVVGLVSRNNFDTTAKVAVNTLAFIAALTQLATPLVSALSQFVGQLNLSKLQGDVLFIGILVLALLASKNAVRKTVENLYKS